MSTFLEGTLVIDIRECVDLGNADGWMAGHSDAYAFITLDGKEIARTATINNTSNPSWDETFHINVNAHHESLVISIFDEDTGKKDDLLGSFPIDLGKLKSDGVIDADGEDLQEPYGGAPSKIFCKLTLQRPHWACKDATFPMRKGCRTTLYQSAHTGGSDPEHHPPEIYCDEGVAKYTPTPCWEEIYRKILNAKKFVYITGWSVNCNISLLRVKPIYRGEKGEEPTLDDSEYDDSIIDKMDSAYHKKKEKMKKKMKEEEKKRKKALKEMKHGKKKAEHKGKTVYKKVRGEEGMMTIGELLKVKANEGLTVIVHIWNEALSVSSCETEVSQGLMCTHDEETMLYFQNTNVICRLSYREGSDWGASYIWTHHQKSVMVDDDVPGDENKRRIVGFVGGLDLCDGRWDTPKKPLFRTLQSHHKGDFHQVWPGIVEEYGPRQPWEDIHSKVEGPVVRDVVTNFEQRWRKQHADLADALLDFDTDEYLTIKEEEIEHQKSWEMQFIRSIDSTSCTQEGVERSIQNAYINAIRAAQKFIFIENQYFMGSSKHWLKERAGCENDIPIEIVTKIINKIKNDEEFKVYIIIPMYPEGVPADGAVQEILHWQYLTQQMMYHKVQEALDEKGSGKSATDYINFYFLGNRESTKGSEGIVDPEDIKAEVLEVDAEGNQLALATTRRFQVYVHSKMLIVDDEYILVGSANINERSLNGARDTEMAVAGYQPYYTGDNAKGQVHQFRMSLWAEHMGCSEKVFVHPNTDACLERVTQIANSNWERFMGDKSKDVPSHIMPHLLKWRDGEIVADPELIPDTKASIVGVESLTLPNKLTM